MKIAVKDIEKYEKPCLVTWKYNNLERVLNRKFGNNFDAIITYNVKEKWLIIHFLRYGIQGDKNLSEIINLDSTRFITNINELDKYFSLDDKIDMEVYRLLKKDLTKDEFEFCEFAQETKDFVENTNIKVDNDYIEHERISMGE